MYNNFDGMSPSVLENSIVSADAMSNNSSLIRDLSEIEATIRNSDENHLKHAKLHHLSSFLSRTSRSNDSPTHSVCLH